uniref:RING-type E3 ubiquitin transferase n=1 Tax=Picea sitchensis TaxID=3332 RepID=A9NSZ4_PICSI|nr:unknown [Picea sitchensis]
MAGGNKDVTNGIFELVSFVLLLFFVLLFAVILLLFMICVYRGQFNISWRRLFSFARGDPLNLRNVGLDARVVESLPVFEYKAQSFKEALECAICLSEFEDNEKARLLPNCKHSFHVDCIDMWFRSHSTCPICRTGAQPKKRVGKNSTDEISINVELISSGNR